MSTYTYVKNPKTDRYVKIGGRIYKFLINDNIINENSPKFKYATEHENNEENKSIKMHNYRKFFDLNKKKAKQMLREDDHNTRAKRVRVMRSEFRELERAFWKDFHTTNYSNNELKEARHSRIKLEKSMLWEACQIPNYNSLMKIKMRVLFNNQLD